MYLLFIVLYAHGLVHFGDLSVEFVNLLLQPAYLLPHIHQPTEHQVHLTTSTHRRHGAPSRHRVRGQNVHPGEYSIINKPCIATCE